MKRIFFFSLAILAWASAFAQIRLSVSVVDAQNNQPIPFASVTLNGDARAESNQDGVAVFSVKSGKHKLKVVASHYEESQKEINVGENETVVNLKFRMQPTTTVLNPVEVSALRANAKTAMSFETLNKEDIQKQNNGRDVPYILEATPSVVVTSDAGAGIGYTNMRVRGSDITRINVTVNGIPQNDAESHGVYWVNMPDLASSTNSLQIQRGVGTSTNGAAAFGASLNMETDGAQKEPSAMLHVGGGSFNTQRITAQFGTGLINKNWWVNGRMSRIKSDGYLDRASSDLQSFYASGGFINKKTSVRAVVFGGDQKTYQAWNGIDSATFADDPTFNSAGAIYNANGDIVDYYDNETDNYKQTHYQLHLNQALRNNLKLNVSLHYTKGAGYYEQYKQDGDFAYYGLDPIIMGNDTINSTDLVRRKWLDNDFYGGIFNLEYAGEKLISILGGGVHNYEGDHFGEIIWARYASQSEIRDHYYNSYSNKLEWNIYWKNLYQITNNFTGFVDVQLRSVQYGAHGLDDDVGAFNYEQNSLFFNPKLGLTYALNPTDKVFLSYAVSNKEPNRTDLIYADPDDLPQPETLHDIELGYDFTRSKFALRANAFYMNYTNQLVLSGKLDAVGYPIRENVGKSYRTGIEISLGYQPAKWVQWTPNFTYMKSVNQDYKITDANDQVQNLGNTAISFSPEIIAASTIEFYPLKGFTVGLFSKFVGEQYLDNTQNDRLTLPSYLVNDLRLSYQFSAPVLQSVRLYVNVNNILNEKYASNGYTWGTTPYYYAQAGTNFLAGLQVSF